MRRFKEYLMMDCYAFTVVTLFNSSLMALGKIEGEVSLAYALTIFIVTSIISLLILITDYWTKNNGIITHIVRVIDIIVPVMLYGMITTGFTLDLRVILSNLLICSLMYGIVYIMMFLSWREKDQKANESLERMRELRKR